jgi:hypothetical protein
MQFIEGSDGDRVQGNSSRVSVLGFGKMDLPAFEVDLAPMQAVLLAHPHPSMDGQKEVRQELFKSVPDGSAKTDLFRVGQEADAPSTFRFPTNAGPGITVDLLIVDANPEDQRECCLPAIPTARSPIPCLRLFGQPCDDVALLDRFHGPRTEFRKELINAQPELVCLLLAVLGLTVCKCIAT